MASRRGLRGAIGLGFMLLWLVLLFQQIRTGGASWIFSWAVELSVAASVLLAAWAMGRRILAAIWSAGCGRPGARFVEIALGLGAMSLGVFLLGLAGWIGRLPIAIGLLVAAVAGIVDLAPSVRGWVLGDPAPGEAGRWVETLVLLLPLGCGFAYAATPPVFYDAVVYHLGLPNLYLASGTLEYPASFSLAGYPQYAELMLLPALAAGNETAARILSFLVSAVAALALRGIVRERLGRGAGNLTFLVLVSQWFFWFQAAFLKLDLVGAFFLLCALWILMGLREDDGARPVVVAGLLAGIAAGVKFTNLLPLAIAAASMPLLVGRATRLETLRRAVLLGAVALALASPWMIRNVMHRGNPLFPAFYELLGGRNWQPHNAARMRAETGMEIDRSPVAAALRVARIGWRGGYGSGGELSPVWVPLLLVGLFLPGPRELRWLVACSAASLVLGVACFTSYLRVFAFALTVTAIVPGMLWSAFRSHAARVLIGAAAAAVVAFGLLDSVRLCEIVSARASRVIAGRIAPRDYADEQLSYLPLARRINESLPPGVRIRLLGTARSAYIHRPCIASYAWDDPWVARLADPLAEADRLRAELRGEGFTHVLLDPGEMDRLERASGIFGYAGSAEARERIDRFFRGLPVEASANGVYLFRLTDELAGRATVTDAR